MPRISVGNEFVDGRHSLVRPRRARLMPVRHRFKRAHDAGARGHLVNHPHGDGFPRLSGRDNHGGSAYTVDRLRISLGMVRNPRDGVGHKNLGPPVTGHVKPMINVRFRVPRL